MGGKGYVKFLAALAGAYIGYAFGAAIASGITLRADSFWSRTGYLELYSNLAEQQSLLLSLTCLPRLWWKIDFGFSPTCFAVVAASQRDQCAHAAHRRTRTLISKAVSMSAL